MRFFGSYKKNAFFSIDTLEKGILFFPKTYLFFESKRNGCCAVHTHRSVPKGRRHFSSSLLHLILNILELLFSKIEGESKQPLIGFFFVLPYLSASTSAATKSRQSRQRKFCIFLFRFLHPPSPRPPRIKRNAFWETIFSKFSLKSAAVSHGAV